MINFLKCGKSANSATSFFKASFRTRCQLRKRCEKSRDKTGMEEYGASMKREVSQYNKTAAKEAVLIRTWLRETRGMTIPDISPMPEGRHTVRYFSGTFAYFWKCIVDARQELGLRTLERGPSMSWVENVFYVKVDYDITTIAKALDYEEPLSVTSPSTLAEHDALCLQISEELCAKQWAWVSRVGHALVDNVELEIGGTRITRGRVAGMVKEMRSANPALTRGVAYGRARRQASLSEDVSITPLDPPMTSVLYPEEAQPSGSVNISRLDSVERSWSKEVKSRMDEVD